MSATRRLLLFLIAAGVAGAWLRRLFESAPPSLPHVAPDDGSGPLDMGPVTDEMNAIPLPLEEELALVEEAAPAVGTDEDTAEHESLADGVPDGDVDIVSVVDDLIESENPESRQ